MVGPSAIGSENGMPISIRLAPAASIAGSTAAVAARSGYPAGTNGISAICLRWRRVSKVEQIVCRATVVLISERDDTSDGAHFKSPSPAFTIGCNDARLALQQPQ